MYNISNIPQILGYFIQIKSASRTGRLFRRPFSKIKRILFIYPPGGLAKSRDAMYIETGKTE
jgi:hypothetical protein